MAADSTIQHVLSGESRWCVDKADAVEWLRGLEDNSIDSMVTDPPAGIGLMGRAWDRYSTDLPDPAFMNWFAGFVDGEGCFSVHRKPQGTYDCQFAISVRDDDLPILQQIRSVLGIGTIGRSKTGANPKASYRVSSKKDCIRLAEILRAAPLRAKKATDFELWLEALDEWIRHKPSDWESMADARERLMRSRYYTDYGKVAGPPERRAFVVQMTRIFREALRVLKPGAHAFVWALPRTAHWTATALEDAGFEIRSKHYHLFGSAMGKGLDVSKALDAASGAERRVIGTRLLTGNAAVSCKDKGGTYGVQVGTAPAKEVEITEPATELAQQYDDWNTNCKPAAEEWILVRKPFKGTVAANVAEWGTGALNIGACRVPSGPDHEEKCASVVGLSGNRTGRTLAGGEPSERGDSYNPGGRWPPTVLLSHGPGCRIVGERLVKGDNRGDCDGRRQGGFLDTGSNSGDGEPNSRVYGDATEPVFECEPGCPVRLIAEQSGIRPGMSGGGKHRADYQGGMFGSIDSTSTARGDTGTAARFFPQFLYHPKASSKIRDAGCEHIPLAPRKDGTPGKARNNHATVKDDDVMRWLVRLVTPPGGLVIDPFTGSGSTGRACTLEGFRFAGCELGDPPGDDRNVQIARARIAHVAGWHCSPHEKPDMGIEVEQGSLF